MKRLLVFLACSLMATTITFGQASVIKVVTDPAGAACTATSPIILYWQNTSIEMHGCNASNQYAEIFTIAVGSVTGSLAGDVSGTLGATQVDSVQNNSVALSTDTTGFYVASIADAGNSTVTVVNGSGSEGLATTLDVVNVNCADCLTTTEVDETTLDHDTLSGFVAGEHYNLAGDATIGDGAEDLKTVTWDVLGTGDPVFLFDSKSNVPKMGIDITTGGTLTTLDGTVGGGLVIASPNGVSGGIELRTTDYGAVSGTTQNARLKLGHYCTDATGACAGAEEPVTLMIASGTSTITQVVWGGGSTSENMVTAQHFVASTSGNATLGTAVSTLTHEAFRINGGLSVPSTFFNSAWAMGLSSDGTAPNGSCVGLDTDRWYADLDCDATKDGGEEYFDLTLAELVANEPTAITLGTDTDGFYVASITNGTGITGGDGGSEGAALTIAATLGTDIAVGELDTNLGDAVKYFVGTTLDTVDIAVSSNGATVTATVQQDPTGDIRIFYSDGITIQDCTPACTVSLSAGTDTSPTLNYVYFLKSTGLLTASTSDWPAGEHSPVATVLVQSAASVQTDGLYKMHAWTDHVASTQGHLGHVNEWIRSQNATWRSGVVPTLTITPGSPDTVIFTSTAGVVLQLHDHAFPAQTGTPDIYVVNDSGTPYTKITDLASALTDSTGASMSTKYFSLVIWGVVSEDSGDSHLFLNLPDCSYNTLAGVTADPDGCAVYSIPSDFTGTGFLIAEYKLQHSSGGGGDWTEHEEIDLRGLLPAVVAGGSGSGGGATEFSDTAFRVLDNSDPTKEIAFEASGITTATTRTITVPDYDMTLKDWEVASQGTIVVTNGGSGANSFTDGGVLLGSGTGAFTALGQATNGQLVIGSTGADPVLAGITGGTNLSVVNGAGSITLNVDDAFITNDTDDNMTGMLTIDTDTDLETQLTVRSDTVVGASIGVLIDTDDASANANWVPLKITENSGATDLFVVDYTGKVTTGNVSFEAGGLEANVSSFNGLVAIEGGPGAPATTNITTLGELNTLFGTNIDENANPSNYVTNDNDDVMVGALTVDPDSQGATSSVVLSAVNDVDASPVTIGDFRSTSDGVITLAATCTGAGIPYPECGSAGVCANCSGADANSANVTYLKVVTDSGVNGEVLFQVDSTGVAYARGGFLAFPSASPSLILRDLNDEENAHPSVDDHFKINGNLTDTDENEQDFDWTISSFVAGSAVTIVSLDADDGPDGGETNLVLGGTAVNVALGTVANGILYDGSAGTLAKAGTGSIIADEVTCTDCVEPTALATYTVSAPFNAGSWALDGTHCVLSADQQHVVGGPKVDTVLCADNDAASFESHMPMPDGWDAGNIRFKIYANQTAASTATCSYDCEAQCRGNDDAISAWSGITFDSNVDLTLTADGDQIVGTGGSISVDGTCAAGDTLYWKCDFDTVASGACNAEAALSSVVIEYGITDDDN